MQALLDAYKADLNGKEEGVPESLLQSATELVKTSVREASPGPAEAAQDEVPAAASNGALVDTAPAETLALQQIGRIVQEHEKLGLC